jgi:N utilization substance protein A
VLFVTNGLSPAKVQRVSIVDDHERVMEVVVEDKQLSLAIGKKGQNVRLAAKLTGWRIDIKSEEEKRREVEAQLLGLEGPAEQEVEAVPLALPGIHDEVVAQVQDAGYATAQSILDGGIEGLTAHGLDEETAQAVLEAAQAVRAEEEARAAEAAAQPDIAAEAESVAEGEATAEAGAAATDTEESAPAGSEEKAADDTADTATDDRERL